MEQYLNKETFIFKKFQDSTKIGNINELRNYLIKWFEQYPDARVVVGTDSQRYKKALIYVTVIALCYPTVIDTKNNISEIVYCKGAHLLFCKQRIKMRCIDMWTRLWHEVELTRLIAEEVSKTTNKIVEVHLDLNPDVEYASNKLFNAAVGYLKSLQFDVYAKPDSFVATAAADSLTKL